MMFQKCLFFNLYNIIINNKRRQNCEVSRMFLVCLLFWQMIFFLSLLRLFVLKATQRPSLPGGTTWGRHRTTRVSPPGCSTCCMFLSVFTLYSRSICKSSDTRRLTESTKQNMKPRSETGREAKVEGFKEKQSRFSPETRSCSRRADGWFIELSWTCRFWRLLHDNRTLLLHV